jgi:hypothetical protein
MLEYILTMARDLAYGLTAPINTICVQLLHQRINNLICLRVHLFKNELIRYHICRHINE